MHVDLALLGYDDPRLSDLEWHIVKAAQPHDANTLYRLQTVPGIGNILSLVRLDDIPDMQRFPSVQEFVSSCRLVKCAKESAGTTRRTSGTTRGQAFSSGPSRQRLCSCRANPAGQQSRTRLEKKHGQGNALTLLAQQLGRAVYDRLTRQQAFDMKLSPGVVSGAGEPDASRDVHGVSLKRVL